MSCDLNLPIVYGFFGRVKFESLAVIAGPSGRLLENAITEPDRFLGSRCDDAVVPGGMPAFRRADFQTARSSAYLIFVGYSRRHGEEFTSERERFSQCRLSLKCQTMNGVCRML